MIEGLGGVRVRLIGEGIVHSLAVACARDDLSLRLRN